MHGQIVKGVPVPVQVARYRSHAIFSQTFRESRLEFETRTPTIFGEARVFAQLDWFGGGSFLPEGANPLTSVSAATPRMRSAFGTLGGLLAGQALSNFRDFDAFAETLDFGGDPGLTGLSRIPQLRYSHPLAGVGLLGVVSVSAEAPETQLFTPGGIAASDTAASPTATATVSTTACTASRVAALGIAPTITCTIAGNLPATNITKAPVPDLTAVWYIPQPWGHLQLGAVVRPALQVKDGAFIDKRYVGYGGAISGDVKPGWFGWEKDDIKFNIVAGDALGRYLSGVSNAELVTNFAGTGATASTVSRDLANNVLFKPVREWGASIGYLHWWASDLRSNASVGIQHLDVNSQLLGSAVNSTNKELATAHVNLIWNPVAFADVGVEYMWGHRVVVSNLKGDEHALINRYVVRF